MNNPFPEPRFPMVLNNPFVFPAVYADDTVVACPYSSDTLVLSLCPTHSACMGVSDVKLRRAYFRRDDRRVPFDFSYNRYEDCDDAEGCLQDPELLYHCYSCRRRAYRCGSPYCGSVPGPDGQDYCCTAYGLPSLLHELRAVGDGPDTTSCFELSIDVLWDSWRFWPDRWLSMDLSLPSVFVYFETTHGPEYFGVPESFF